MHGIRNDLQGIAIATAFFLLDKFPSAKELLMFETPALIFYRLVGGLALCASLGSFIAPGSAGVIRDPPADGRDMVSGHLKQQPQAPARDALLQLAGRPLQVGDLTFVARGAMLVEPSGKSYFDATSAIGLVGLPSNSKVTYRVFPTPAAAEDYLSKDPQPTNFRGELPAGTTAAEMEYSSYHSEETDSAGKRRFPGQFLCNNIHSAEQSIIIASCAFRPAGSAIVAIVTTERRLSPGDTGSDDFKMATLNTDFAAASNLLGFLSARN
jgi:hypothetical protein